jgi:hypothetical protein
MRIDLNRTDSIYAVPTKLRYLYNLFRSNPNVGTRYLAFGILILRREIIDLGVFVGGQQVIILQTDPHGRIAFDRQ